MEKAREFQKNIYFCFIDYAQRVSGLEDRSIEIIYICNSGEGNGTPLQYSCLENPMDGGAW